MFFVPFYASSSRSAAKLAPSNLYTKLITHLRTSAPYWDRCVHPVVHTACRASPAPLPPLRLIENRVGVVQVRRA